MNEECISVLIYLTGFFLFLPKRFVDEIILIETNRIIKGPGTEFDEFLRLIGIWMSMTENPGTNWTEYFSKNPIDIFSGCSIYVNQLLSGNSFEGICSALKFTDTPPPPLTFEINSMKSDR